MARLYPERRLEQSSCLVDVATAQEHLAQTGGSVDMFRILAQSPPEICLCFPVSPEPEQGLPTPHQSFRIRRIDLRRALKCIKGFRTPAKPEEGASQKAAAVDAVAVPLEGAVQNRNGCLRAMSGNHGFAKKF
jgi:hypothetical protein